tara:strand:- start:4769 stop:5986 length:1218 start_codon:yes stop_codon:yes gene_type:complete
MKLILIIIVALVIASGLAYQVHLDPGYVLLSYDTWSVETSLAVLLFLLFVLFIGFHLSLRFLLAVKHAPKSISQWHHLRQRSRSMAVLNRGLLDSAEGNWQRAEKLLIKSAQRSETPLLNYLTAAHAAQSLGAYDRRDTYLLQAGDTLPEHIHAIHLTRAKLQLAAAQYEQALASLQQLKVATPKHPIVLTLLMQSYAHLKDWQALYELLPAIKKNRDIDDSQWLAFEQKALQHLLSEPTNQGAIESVWQNLDKKQKLQPDYLVPYINCLHASKQYLLAEEWLVKALNQQAHPDLLNAYSQLAIEPNKKTKQLEKWLKSAVNNTDILNALATQCLEQKLWGKATYYLEQSLSVTPTRAAYFLFGKLLEQQGESTEKAAAYYKQALACGDKNPLANLLSQPVDEDA